MKMSRIIFTILGLTQSIIGILTGALAILLGSGIINVQDIFNLSAELLPLYLLFLSLFSIFSIINGLILILKKWKPERREHVIG